MRKTSRRQSDRKKKTSAAVVGIGRVGLPLALILANSGYHVFGIDKDGKKTELINKGIMPFMERGATILLRKVVNKDFLATVDYSCIKQCDYIVLTLGTPIDENMNPVYDQINAAVNSMKNYLRPGQTLILRSTVSPGTTRYVKSVIESLDSLKIGKNFFLAFCPERIAEGQALEEIATIPQMIGGVDEESSVKAQKLFKAIGVDTVLTDDVSAELAKLFTNMYRYINFAIANEFMVLADYYKREIYEVIHLVNYGYTRGGVSLPGFTAGPCLFKDGFFMISDVPFADLFLTSWKINESAPNFLIKKIKETMTLANKKAVILGVAFKAEIDDIRASLSFKVRKALIRERMRVVLHDPYVREYTRHTVEQDVYQSVKNADLIFVGTNHKAYKQLDIEKIKKLVKTNCVVCDVWNVFGTGKLVFRLKEIIA